MKKDSRDLLSRLTIEIGKPEKAKFDVWTQVGSVFVTVLTLTATHIAGAFFTIPNIASLYLTAVVYSAFSGGLYMGLLSAAIVLGYVLYFYSVPGEFFRYTPENIQRIIVLAATMPIVAIMVGVLKKQTERLIFEHQARLQAEATADLIRRLQAVTDITLTYLELPELLNKVLGRVRGLLGADTASILLKDPKSPTLIPLTSRGFVGGKQDQRIPFGKGFAGKIAQERRPMALEHVKKTDVINPFILKSKIKSILGVPLLVGNRVIGVLHVGTRTPRKFSPEDRQLLQLVGDRIALAIDRAAQFQKAKEAIRARDEFLSIASHELKTPLTTMLLQLQGVLRSIKEQSLAKFSIERMLVSLESAEQQSKRLGRLINDLLNVSLITSGRLELEIEETDLTKMVRDLVVRLESEAKLAGSKLKIIVDGKVVGFWDKLRIEQVVTNLLSNAIKYGGGKPITVSVQKEKDTAVLTVSDNGIGIPEDKMKHIFNRFERAVSSKDYKGLGVGLYISSQIVAAHKGRISVQSKLNHGSTFVVELPIRKPS